MTMMSTSLSGCRATASNFTSASWSIRTPRPCSFTSLMRGATRITPHSAVTQRPPKRPQGAVDVGRRARKIQARGRVEQKALSGAPAFALTAITPGVIVLAMAGLLELRKAASRRRVLVNRVSSGSMKLRSFAIALLFAAMLLPPASSSAQQSKQSTQPLYPRQYVGTMWGNEHGLPGNWVTSVAQDKQGYLWVATIGGVARFDGARFTEFNPTGQDTRTLCVYGSRDGALWIGTADYGVTRVLNGKAVTYGEREGLPSSFVSSVLEDRSGNVWINTSKGAARLTAAKVEPYPAHRGRPVREFLLEQSDGSMWFRSGKDVVRFGPDGATATLHGGSIVREDHDGSVWIEFQDAYRLVRYQAGTFSDVPLPKSAHPQWAPPFPDQGVAALATDRNGDLLVLTSEGIARTENGKLTVPQRVVLLGNDEAIKAGSLTVDREGNLWIGTLGSGLVRARPALVSAYGKNEGLSDGSFTCVFQDREGRVWLGGDSLYWFDGRAFHVVPGLADIRAITQSHDGDLWFGGSGGLYRWRSGALSRFKISDPAVMHILEDRDGTMWVETQTYDRPGGLYRFREGNFELVRAGRGMQIEADRKGGIWQATLEGLHYLRGDNDVVHKEALGTTTGIYQDPSGTLWLASYGVGLVRFKESQYKKITVKDGLPHNRVEGVVADDNGFLWVSSDHNIFRVSLRELNDFADGKRATIAPPVVYGIAEGMKTSECNSGDPAGWKTRDGRIWFPTVRGVVAIDPTRLNDIVPPVVLEEAPANDIGVGYPDEKALPPGKNTFDFRFTALSLSAPEKLRFKYRLDPYDKDWIEAGTQRTAHYTNMAPGTYSFRVIAANDFGVWNDQGATVQFVLRPHYYQTNWFRILCAILFLGVMWLVYQWRVRYLHHQFERTLDARVAERTRIARELHDTLLQSFHGLLLKFQTVAHLLPDRPAEAKEKLENAIDSAADAITQGRDAVQDLRASAAEKNDLALAINTLGEELSTQLNGNRPAFRVAVEGHARELHPIVRDEIYKIAAEALRNAFQHARARQIEVEIRYDDDELRMRVRDDGKGIDPSVSREGVEGHFGLQGMKERATLVGAKLTVWSEVDTGTEVELRVSGRTAYAKSPKRATHTNA